jgi:hypothetical protein
MNDSPKVKRKILPTPRIAFAKQLDLLRAFAAASGAARKPVGNAETAPYVSLSKNTVSLANPFFADIGLVERAGGGFVPSQEVVNFAQAYEWDADRAPHELAPVLERSWFGEALLPRLGFGPLVEKEALRIIDTAASAGPEYESQLRIVLDYLETAGLIERDAGNVRSAPRSAAQESPKTAQEGDRDASPSKVAPTVPEGSRSLPLLIQGLLQELPRGSTWDRESADRWLNLAKLTFEMVYDFPSDPMPEQPVRSDEQILFPAGEKQDE